MAKFNKVPRMGTIGFTAFALLDTRGDESNDALSKEVRRIHPESRCSRDSMATYRSGYNGLRPISVAKRRLGASARSATIVPFRMKKAN